jgi:hypothetical protein
MSPQQCREEASSLENGAAHTVHGKRSGRRPQPQGAESSAMSQPTQSLTLTLASEQAALSTSVVIPHNTRFVLI